MVADPLFPKVWVPSTVDKKGEPILEGAKAMYDLVVYRKLMKAMIILNDYDAAIYLSWEEHRHKLDRAPYHISFLLDSRFSVN